MKLYKIFNITAGIAMLAAGASCSSDYLDLKPEGTLEFKEVLPTEDGATLAVYGMCASMYKQYSSIDDNSLGFNGEPEICQYYGEAMGQDWISLFWQYYGGTSLLNWVQMNSSLYGGSQAAWGYYYYLISQANNLITFAPKVHDEDGNEVEKSYGIGKYQEFNPVFDVDPAGLYAFRLAQALTIRAHSYTRLMQIYCARYEQSTTSKGEPSLTVPLRLTYQDAGEDLSCGLATWEELRNQIYADLSQALELYSNTYYNRSFEWEPNADVAKGLYARIAMITHDWDTAAQMAHEARTGYPLMSVDEYQEGFAVPNSEWMWTNSGEAQGIYFWSFGATYACNGAYPCRWGNIGASAIDNNLIKQFGDGGALGNNAAYDMRCSLFFSPRNVLGNVKNFFWSRDNCNEQTMDITTNTAGNLYGEFFNKCQNTYKKVSGNGWDPPYTKYGYSFVKGNSVTATFGAQFKFWGTDPYSSSHYPFMRAAEMLLIEAEALYEKEEYKAADDLLYELLINRYATDRNGESYYNQDYSKNPEKLIQAIKLNRRMELWGEGFNWFDFKRWNEEITRQGWVQGDINSGNWPEMFQKVFPVDMSNGWRWRIPTSELRYNTDINYNMATTGDDW